jgi:Cysteine-rich secretory protein family
MKSRIFFFGIILLAVVALFVSRPVFAATVATKNKLAYQKMSALVCLNKSNKTLRTVACPLLKVYQKKPAIYTDAAFIKTVCIKNRTACSIFYKIKGYSTVAAPFLATSKTTAPKKLTSTEGNTSDPSYTEPGFIPEDGDSSASDPLFSDGNTAQATSSDQAPLYQQEREQLTFANSEEKINFTVNALLTGKNYPTLYKMKPSDFSIEEITQVMNRFRAAFGLSPVTYNPEISKIAQKHANYLAANAEGMLVLDTSRPNYQPEDFHNEARSHTGFTGVTPTDRAIAGGYTKYPFLEGVGHELEQSFPAHMYGTLYAPLHRQELLTASMKEFGFADKATLGNSESGSFKNDARIFSVINYAYDNSQPGEKDLVFPPSGTTLYDYTRELYEIPYPFDLGGIQKHHAFSFTINNQSGGLDRSSIKLYDVTDGKFLPLSLDNYWVGTSVAHVAIKNPATMLPNHSYKLIFKDLAGNDKTAEYKAGNENINL